MREKNHARPEEFRSCFERRTRTPGASEARHRTVLPLAHVGAHEWRATAAAVYRPSFSPFRPVKRPLMTSIRMAMALAMAMAIVHAAETQAQPPFADSQVITGFQRAVDAYAFQHRQVERRAGETPDQRSWPAHCAPPGHQRPTARSSRRWWRRHSARGLRSRSVMVVRLPIREPVSWSQLQTRMPPARGRSAAAWPTCCRDCLPSSNTGPEVSRWCSSIAMPTWWSTFCTRHFRRRIHRRTEDARQLITRCLARESRICAR